MDHVAGRSAPLTSLFEKNRWWSNPGLDDVDTMIASILLDPTRSDLALAASLWGPERVQRVRNAIERELTSVHREVLGRFYTEVLEIVRNAPGRAS